MCINSFFVETNNHQGPVEEKSDNEEEEEEKEEITEKTLPQFKMEYSFMATRGVIPNSSWFKEMTESIQMQNIWSLIELIRNRSAAGYMTLSSKDLNPWDWWRKDLSEKVENFLIDRGFVIGAADAGGWCISWKHPEFMRQVD